MTLSDVFELLALQLNVNAADLIAYADEDNIGGYHPSEASSKWPIGSLWDVEGKFLYTLVRAVRPANVLELGCFYGASTSHILAALNANKKGKLLSIDLDPVHGNGPASELRKRWQFEQGEAATYITANKVQADIVYEDLLHDPEGTTRVLTAVRDIVKPKVTVSHDVLHYIVGEGVRIGWDAVYGAGNYNTALIEPSDCGVAWRIA